jgi:hypothetical protein
MVTAIQAVPNISTVGTLLTLGPISQLAQNADSLLALPSVILSLGATAPTPLTYSATGLFVSLLQMPGASPDAADTASTAGTTAAPATGASAATPIADLTTLLEAGTPVAGAGLVNASVNFQNLSATTGAALAALLAAAGNSATPATDALTIQQALARQQAVDANSALAAADTISVEPLMEIAGTTATPVVAASDNTNVVRAAATTAPGTVAGAVGVTAAGATALATATDGGASATATAEATAAVTDNFLLDAIAQALATIAQNPAYANTVAGLYVNVAILRAQQTAALPNAADRPLPVAAIAATRAVPPVEAI